MAGLPMHLLTLSLWAFVAGSLAGLGCWQRQKLANLLAFGCAALGGLCGLCAAVAYLAGVAPPFQRHWDFLASGIPYLRFSVRLDPLSA
ncbi:MAG: hydrogenase 4 subunit B, partial [Verrucomicrobia bacterium]